MKIFYANRRTIRCVVISLLLVCIIAAGIIISRNHWTDSQDLVSRGELHPILEEAGDGLTLYDIEVSFDPERKILDCSQTIDYVNEDDVDFDELYFHIYPNSFKYEDRPVFPPEEMEEAYPNGFSPGFIQIEKVLVDGEAVGFFIEGYSEDILRVDFDRPLKPGERTKIEFQYAVVISNSVGRFGYGSNTFNVTNWYPIVCVYDDEGWNLDPYYPVGDPFYSDVANYRVEITAPKDYVVATTGDILETKGENGQQVWDIQAVAVRDFAWVASDKFMVSSAQANGTTVYSYYYDRKPGLKALDYASWAIDIFSESFGEYPYRQFSVVQADFFIGGMEYPNMVMVDQSLYNDFSQNWLEIITVHETAHQWWYGMVGSDAIDEAWLDEGLTEYSTVLYYGHRYGREKEMEKYEELITKGKYDYLQFYIQGEEIDETIDRSTYEFEDWIVYDLLTYGKGAMMFHDMRERMGDENFYAVLKEYFESNKFKNATREDLMQACERITGQKWDDFFMQWLYD